VKFLHAPIPRKRSGSTTTAKSEQFTASETGKASSFEEIEGTWQKREIIMKKISSPCRIADMPYLYWAKGSVAPILASESASSLQGSPE